MNRRHFVSVLAAVLVVACGGGVSTRLRTQKPGHGDGPVTFSVANLSDTAVNNLYKAPSDAVAKANEEKVVPGSPADEAMWGADLLDGALAPGGSAAVKIEPGRWDFLALDKDGREQHITKVKIAGGGKYVLELGEGGWRAKR